MDISIVMAYYNRRALLIKTLESITNTQYEGSFEIVIVDDASNKENSIVDLSMLFPSLNLKIIQINKNDKWWVNPCVPNNIGFATASGNVVIIQNPECLHIGDIISYTANNIELNKYISFGCYAIDINKTQRVSQIKGENTTGILEIILPTEDVLLDQSTTMNRWYQHSLYSPRCLNFCTAITKIDLDELGGFDEAYARGISYDDTEFIRRINRKKMTIDMIDSPFVIHQCHGYTDYSNKVLVDKNTNLYYSMESSKDYYVVNNETKETIERLFICKK